MEMNHTDGCGLDDHMDHNMDMGGGMGKMFFHFDACQRLLFSSWKITNAGELVGAVVAVFLMAFLYEGLKTLREWLIYYDIKRTKNYEVSKKNNNTDSDDKIKLVDDCVKRPSKVKSFSISLSMHFLQSLLHIVQVGYGYILMFIAMTFNVWLFLAVCFGAGTGYFLFAKTKHIFGVSNREQNDHCH